MRIHVTENMKKGVQETHLQPNMSWGSGPLMYVRRVMNTDVAK